MIRVLSIGECMVELSQDGPGRYRRGFAGDTFNTAWHLRDAAGDGAEVSYFTALGDDTLSDAMVAFMETQRIDTGAILRCAGRAPGLYMIEQRDGDRHFTYWRQNSAARSLANDETALADAVRGRDLVFFSGITLAILTPADRDRLLSTLETCETTLAFDPNIRPALWSCAEEMRDAVERAARLSRYVLPSFDDEAHAFGDESPEKTVARYAGWGCCEIVVKDSHRQVFWQANGLPGWTAVPLVETITDSTGAGDSFDGGYLAARLLGRPCEAPVKDAITRAQNTIAFTGAIPVRSTA